MEQYLIYIKKIVGLDLKGIASTFEDLVSFFIMNEEASQNEIAKCDNYFNQNLPDDYKCFLQNYNGGILFKVEDFAGYKFLNTDELIKQNEFQKENFGEDWDTRIILFCECIGDGEYLGFKLNKKSHYEIIYCIMDMLPKDWDVIEISFEKLINTLLEEKGKKYWLNPT